MLPAGPTSTTYTPPASPPKTAKDLLISIQALIDARVASATALQPGTMTIGCDGLPIINALDGTTCSTGLPSGPMILFNQATRSLVSATPGRSFQSTFVSGASGTLTVITLPGGCAATVAALKAKRRYLDTVGNLYAADGTWISSGNTVAAQNTDYDYKIIVELDHLFLRRLHGNATDATLTNVSAGSVDAGAHTYYVEYVDAVAGNTGPSQGASITLAVGSTVSLTNIPTGPAGTTGRRIYRTTIGSTTGRLLTTINDNSTTTFSDNIPDASIIGNATWSVPTKKITNEALPMVSEVQSVPFNHFGGVCRGIVGAANECVSQTDDVIFSMEANYFIGSDHSGSHGITVRTALVGAAGIAMTRIGRLAFAQDAANLNWTARGQRMAVSTNSEGFFFVNMYDAGLLSSPPVPYPGAEFGAYNGQQMNRNIARFSLDRSSYTPKLEELVLLENKGTAWGVNDYALGISLP